MVVHLGKKDVRHVRKTVLIIDVPKTTNPQPLITDATDKESAFLVLQHLSQDWGQAGDFPGPLCPEPVGRTAGESPSHSCRETAGNSLARLR